MLLKPNGVLFLSRYFSRPTVELLHILAHCSTDTAIKAGSARGCAVEDTNPNIFGFDAFVLIIIKICMLLALIILLETEKSRSPF